MRTFRHWTPRYLLDRIALMIRETMCPNDPWLTSMAVAVLDSWLRPSDRGLEWGSGRSTIWFAERVASVLSVEHEREWYRRVDGVLKAKGISTVDYRFCPDVVEYVAVAEECERESMDFVLVDGIARDKCAVAALARLRPGGVLIVDNSNRFLPTTSRAPRSIAPGCSPASGMWTYFLEQVRDWRCIHTTNGVTDTTLWIKAAR